MARLSEGARQLPLRHLSIRVPWNDTGWTETVCKCPADNIACLILPRIRENREDEKEAKLAGGYHSKLWGTLPQGAPKGPNWRVLALFVAIYV